MSADNGVYILKTKRTALENPPGTWTNGVENFVYRVAHTNAIDNLQWFESKQIYNLGAYMKDVWGESLVFTTETEATLYAMEMAKGIKVLEYGVQLIDMSEYVFYGDL